MAQAQAKPEEGRSATVGIYLHLPRPVMEWLKAQASERYKPTTSHVRDLLVAHYRAKSGPLG